LTSAHGKKVVAKELGLWEGSNGYYAVGHAHETHAFARHPLPAQPFGAVASPHLPNPRAPPFRGAPARYLVYDGVLSTNTGYRFHDQKTVDAILLHLAAVAFVTGAHSRCLPPQNKINVSSRRQDALPRGLRRCVRAQGARWSCPRHSTRSGS
jgi:hypothetical protein